jgi:hypothetical protein
VEEAGGTGPRHPEVRARVPGGAPFRADRGLEAVLKPPVFLGRPPGRSPCLDGDGPFRVWAERGLKARLEPSVVEAVLFGRPPGSAALGS